MSELSCWSLTEPDEVVELEREVASLREALSAAPAIEQATGMLMLAYGFGPGRASDVLTAWAAEFGVSRRTVADRMVEAADTADPARPSPRLSVVPTGLLLTTEPEPTG